MFLDREGQKERAKYFGKLNMLSEVKANYDSFGSNHRLIIPDKTTGVRYLIDTGADISMIPKRSIKGDHLPSNFSLYVANGSIIKTYGQRVITVNFGLRRSFSWQFLIADTNHSINGTDFLSHYNLLVDLRGKKIIDGNTRLNTFGYIKNINDITAISTLDRSHKYHTTIFRYHKTDEKGINSVNEKVRHHIITVGQPIAEKARRLTPEKFKIAKAEFEDMMKKGISRPSSSQWTSPLDMVQQKNREWRSCGDYKRLNSITIPDRYPVPIFKILQINCQVLLSFLR